MASGGYSCISRAGGVYFISRTLFTKGAAFDSGQVSRFCVYVDDYNPPMTCKLKVFRQNGSNIDFIAESLSQTITGIGLNSFTISPISVIAGDYIGIYISANSSSSLSADNVASPGVYYLDEDVTTNKAEIDYIYSSAHSNPSISASYVLDDVYVNSSTGNDSYTGDSCAAGHPKLTFASAYALLASNGTIHICNSGADFSAETVTFTKGFSITVDGDGYCYLPQLS